MAMKCFQFYIGDRKEEPKTPLANSTRSSFTDNEIKQSGSDLNSQDVSNTSTESRGRSQFPNLSDRASNLKVFNFSELKQATKNFGRTTKLGEGGFGCVFKGVIKSSDDPPVKVDVAVKQLGKRGLQVHLLRVCLFFSFKFLLIPDTRGFSTCNAMPKFNYLLPFPQWLEIFIVTVF